jgi:hypothetical protein
MATARTEILVALRETLGGPICSAVKDVNIPLLGSSGFPEAVADLSFALSQRMPDDYVLAAAKSVVAEYRGPAAMVYTSVETGARPTFEDFTFIGAIELLRTLISELEVGTS